MLLRLCISYTNTLICIMDKNTFFFLIQQVTSQVNACILFALSSKQQCKICHRFQCIICVISWCWHFSSVKINERNILLKAKVIIFWVPNSHQQAGHMLAVSWALKHSAYHFWGYTVKINVFQNDGILTDVSIVRVLENIPIYMLCSNPALPNWPQIKRPWNISDSLQNVVCPYENANFRNNINMTKVILISKLPTLLILN